MYMPEDFTYDILPEKKTGFDIGQLVYSKSTNRNDVISDIYSVPYADYDKRIWRRDIMVKLLGIEGRYSDRRFIYYDCPIENIDARVRTIEELYGRV